MKKYAIRVVETLARTVIVEAENFEDAISQVEDAASSGEFILESDDFDEREIVPAGWTENGLVPDDRDVSYYTHLYRTTCINYQYRDASNYKKQNQVIVPGRYTEEQIQSIIDCLQDGEYFIPSKVGFPEERFEDVTEDDHLWFELQEVDFEDSDQKPQMGISPEEMVRIFEKAKDHWEEGVYGC